MVCSVGRWGGGAQWRWLKTAHYRSSSKLQATSGKEKPVALIGES
jgi:hypothetical protein